MEKLSKDLAGFPADQDVPAETERAYAEMMTAVEELKIHSLADGGKTGAVEIAELKTFAKELNNIVGEITGEIDEYLIAESKATEKTRLDDTVAMVREIELHSALLRDSLSSFPEGMTEGAEIAELQRFSDKLPEQMAEISDELAEYFVSEGEFAKPEVRQDFEQLKALIERFRVQIKG
jgi:hypothetical protein